MNKLIITTGIRLSATMVLLLISGCRSSWFDDPHMVQIPEEKLKQVEALDLFAMKAKEPAPSSPETPEEPPETLELTLEKVRALTIENNLNLRAELISPRIAGTAAKSAEARKYELVFQTGITHNKTDLPTNGSGWEALGVNVDDPLVQQYFAENGIVLDLDSAQGEETTLSTGLTAPLETGGALEISLSDTARKTNLSGTTHTTPLTLSLSQPLLKGAGRREFQHSIRLAKYDWQYASASAKLQLINTIATADRAYWELYKSKKILEVRQQQLKLTEKQLESARRFVAAGQKPEVEILRAEAGLAGQQSDIIAAENAYRHSQRNLKYILNIPGLDINGPTELIPQTETAPSFLKLDNKKLVAHAIQNRMELIQLELEMARNASDIAHYRNAKLPDLDLQYYYTINSLDETRSGAYDMLGDKNYEDHRIALILRYPIGNYAGRSDLLAARQRRQQLEFSRADQRAFIEQEVHDALDNLNSSWQQINATRKSAQVDAKLFEAEKRQYEISMRTSTEVLEAQARYANSVSAEYIALANYQIALMQLAQSTGTLLGAAKVE